LVAAVAADEALRQSACIIGSGEAGIIVNLEIAYRLVFELKQTVDCRAV
jgi:hypothetical protein